MRHSVRLDNTASAQWPDRFERPYDSPISDFQLPTQQAKVLQARGHHQYDLVVTSPFRRLQDYQP